MSRCVSASVCLRLAASATLLGDTKVPVSVRACARVPVSLCLSSQHVCLHGSATRSLPMPAYTASHHPFIQIVFFVPALEAIPHQSSLTFGVGTVPPVAHPSRTNRTLVRSQSVVSNAEPLCRLCLVRGPVLQYILRETRKLLDSRHAQSRKGQGSRVWMPLVRVIRLPEQNNASYKNNNTSATIHKTNQQQIHQTEHNKLHLPELTAKRTTTTQDRRSGRPPAPNG